MCAKVLSAGVNPQHGKVSHTAEIKCRGCRYMQFRRFLSQDKDKTSILQLCRDLQHLFACQKMI